MIAQADSGNPATVNYNIFVAIFGVLSLLYLLPAAFNESFQGHALLPIVLDGLNMLFIFAGATALAAGLGVHSCSNGVSLEPKRQLSIFLTLLSGLHPYQSYHEWCRQHEKPLPGGTSCHRIPLVRIRCVRRLIRIQLPQLPWKRYQHESSWYPQG